MILLMRKQGKIQRRFLAATVTMIVLMSSFGLLSVRADTSSTTSIPWSQYHGNAQHTGISRYIGSPTSTVKWSYNTGNNIVSSPAVASDGTIYFGSEDNHLYALNPDGSLKWAYDTGDIVDSSPAIGTDGKIYIGSFVGNVFALNPDGTLAWTYPTGSVLSSPVIGPDGTVYFADSSSTMLFAFTNSGVLKWSSNSGFSVNTALAISPDGSQIYETGEDNNLYAFSSAGGTLLWTYKTSYGSPEALSSPSVGPDGTIYFTSRDATLYAVNQGGTLKWMSGLDAGSVSSPAIGPDGTLYVGTLAGSVFAINSDGSTKWNVKPQSSTALIQESAAIGADGTIYLGDSSGNVFALNAEGSLKWLTKVSSNDFVYSTPAIGPDGSIYIGCTDNHLYAIGALDENSGNFLETLLMQTGASTVSTDVTQIQTELGSFSGGDTVASLMYSIQSSVGNLQTTLATDYNNIQTSLSGIQSSLTSISSSLTSIQSSLDKIGNAAQETSGSGSATLTTTSASAVIFTAPSNKISTVTLTLGASGLSFPRYIVVNYYIDPGNPSTVVSKTIYGSFGDNSVTIPFTDSVAAWKIQVTAVFGHGVSSTTPVSINWAYTALYQP